MKREQLLNPQAKDLLRQAQAQFNQSSQQAQAARAYLIQVMGALGLDPDKTYDENGEEIKKEVDDG